MDVIHLYADAETSRQLKKKQKHCVNYDFYMLLSVGIIK